MSDTEAWHLQVFGGYRVKGNFQTGVRAEESGPLAAGILWKPTSYTAQMLGNRSVSICQESETRCFTAAFPRWLTAEIRRMNECFALYLATGYNLAVKWTTYCYLQRLGCQSQTFSGENNAGGADVNGAQLHSYDVREPRTVGGSRPEVPVLTVDTAWTSPGRLVIDTSSEVLWEVIYWPLRRQWHPRQNTEHKFWFMSNSDIDTDNC